MTHATFSEADLKVIAEAVRKDDFSVLTKAFPGPLRLAQAAQEADRYRARMVRDTTAAQSRRAAQIRESILRELGISPVSGDESRLIEAHEDGTFLLRDAPGAWTGAVVADRTAHRDRS